MARITVPEGSAEARRAAQAELRRRELRRAERLALPIDAWMERYFFIPETDDHHLVLAPYQKAALREAERRQADGKYAYSTVVWSDIKKSIKSTLAAAVIAFVAERTPWGSVKIVANDLKQADSREAFYLRRAIELNPEWSKEIKITPSGYKVEWPNHARVEAIPVDPKGEAGGNDDLVVYTELWGANSKAAQSMWTESTLSPTKFGYSRRWVETYAGFSGEAPILEQLYDQGVKSGRQLDLSYTDEAGAFHDLSDLEVFANDAARLLCLWNTRPRLPWQSADYYAQEAAALAPNEFLRVHRNQWVSSTEAFVPPEWWDACYDPNLPPAQAGETQLIAMDGAVTNDSFGVVAVAKHPTLKEHFVVRYVNAWTPPVGGRIDFQGTPAAPGPELEVRRLCQERYVIQVAYDPMQLEDMANRLRKEGVAWLRPFSQGRDRLIGDAALRTKIMERKIHHDGSPLLREHIVNANAQLDKETRQLRIVKRQDQRKIDLAVALSMAVAQGGKWLPDPMKPEG